MGVSCAWASTTTALDPVGAPQEPLDPQSCDGGQEPQVPPQPSSPHVLFPQAGEQAPPGTEIEELALDELWAPASIAGARLDDVLPDELLLVDEPSVGVAEFTLEPQARRTVLLTKTMRRTSMRSCPADLMP
jgi:hypothetical protein